MFYVYISWRYLRRRPTAGLAVIAVTFGVATLMIVLSIMDGYVIRLRQSIRDLDSHLSIISKEPSRLCDFETIQPLLSAVPHVTGVAPTIERAALFGGERLRPCLLRGVDPRSELETTKIGSFFYRHQELARLLLRAEPNADTGDENTSERESVARSILSAQERSPLSAEEIETLFSLEHRRALVEGLPSSIRDRLKSARSFPSAVIVGLQLLLSEEITLGQVVKVITVEPGGSRLVEGSVIVAGAFRSGNHEVDSRVFFVQNGRMATLLDSFDPQSGQICFDRIRIALDDHRFAAEAKREIASRLSGLPRTSGMDQAVVVSWEEQKQTFLKAVATEKWITSFVISLLNVFTGCMLLVMLLLLVIEKTRDCGILMAIGATPSGVLCIFLLTGVFIIVTGTVAGLLLGTAVVLNLNTFHNWVQKITGYPLFDPEVYHLDQIPVVISPMDMLLSALPAVLLGLLSSLIPAIRAARKNPVETIRVE
jgi:lipoprotein-releasing system permease protein